MAAATIENKYQLGAYNFIFTPAGGDATKAVTLGESYEDKDTKFIFETTTKGVKIDQLVTEIDKNVTEANASVTLSIPHNPEAFTKLGLNWVKGTTGFAMTDPSGTKLPKGSLVGYPKGGAADGPDALIWPNVELSASYEGIYKKEGATSNTLVFSVMADDEGVLVKTGDYAKSSSK